MQAVQPTRKDGNCLFNALSDQLFGHQDNHLMLRQKVVQQMRENRERYEVFMNLDEHKFSRRRKSKNAASDDLYEGYLRMMERRGEWGDHVEAQAFADRFNIDVLVRHEDGIENEIITAPEFINEHPRHRAEIAYFASHAAPSWAFPNAVLTNFYDRLATTHLSVKTRTGMLVFSHVSHGRPRVLRQKTRRARQSLLTRRARRHRLTIRAQLHL